MNDYWDYRAYTSVYGKLPKVYKVTNSNNRGGDGLYWGNYVTHISMAETAAVNDPKALIAYTHPVTAFVLQRLFDDVAGDPVIWEAEAEIRTGCIEGIAICKQLKTVRKFPITLGMTNRIRFGFGCVNKVYKDGDYSTWILDWWKNKTHPKYTTKDVIDLTYRISEKKIAAAKPEGQHKIFCPEGFATAAAHFMAKAADGYYKIISSEIKDIELNLARAVMYATYAANQTGADINLPEIAEKAFIAQLK